MIIFFYEKVLRYTNASLLVNRIQGLRPNMGCTRLVIKAPVDWDFWQFEDAYNFLNMLWFSLEPVCAVGHGVAALCCATNEDKTWVFQGYSLTGVGWAFISLPGIFFVLSYYKDLFLSGPCGLRWQCQCLWPYSRTFYTQIHQLGVFNLCSRSCYWKGAQYHPWGNCFTSPRTLRVFLSCCSMNFKLSL